MEMVINDLNWVARNYFNEPADFSIDLIALDPRNPPPVVWPTFIYEEDPEAVETPAAVEAPSVLNSPQHLLLKAQFYPIIGIIPAALGVIVFTIELVVGVIFAAKAAIHGVFSSEPAEDEAEFNHAVEWVEEGAYCLIVSIVNPIVVNLAYIPLKISHLVITNLWVPV